MAKLSYGSEVPPSDPYPLHPRFPCLPDLLLGHSPAHPTSWPWPYSIPLQAWSLCCRRACLKVKFTSTPFFKASFPITSGHVPISPSRLQMPLDLCREQESFSPCLRVQGKQAMTAQGINDAGTHRWSWRSQGGDAQQTWLPWVTLGLLGTAG